MKPKIAIISSAHFCDYIKWMITYYHLNLEEHCTLHYYEYDQSHRIRRTRQKSAHIHPEAR